jgi:hypothetical protein
MKGYLTLSRQPKLKVGMIMTVYANINHATRLASLELCKGSTQQALAANISTGKNRKEYYI